MAIKLGFLKQWAQRKNKVKTEDNKPAVVIASRINEELERLALKKMFNKPEFSILDGLNEYDEDYSFFKPRGELITQEMLRTTERMAEKTQQPGKEKVLSETGVEDSEENGSQTP